ncbi:uncharacterized protein [Penaeus vannamei]|uniref:uncharacterized protein n=1 Tax=Penaeus vannamei TaxID=6689 RepID=UPI00387F4C2C
MTFDVNEFVQSPSVEILNELRKCDLLKVAEYFKISVRVGLRKNEIRNEIIKYMVERDMLDMSALTHVEDTGNAWHEHAHMIRLKELELENEFRMRELEIQRELKLKELEMRCSVSTSVPFNVANNVKLVPPFQEKAVDKYFNYFEKIALSSGWPKEYWTVLFQSVLVGKAQDIYMCMPVDECGDYEKVKSAILKGYELVPEAYRLKFRSLRKTECQNYLEFAREKADLFIRWCESERIFKDYDKLCQLLLVEEFKKCVPERIRIYLNENRVNDLDRTARMAEDFSLIHKPTSIEGQRKDNFTKGNMSPQSSPPTGNINEYKKGTASPGQSSNGNKRRPIRCFNCNLLGHTKSNCWFLKERRSKDVPTALASVRDSDDINLNNNVHSIGKVRAEFRPFCSKGTVSMVGEEGSEKPVIVFRDTGSLMSLMLEGMLPLSKESSVGANAILAGIECGQMSVPLHRVHLKCDYIDMDIIVGVVSKFPLEGVSFILANDLAKEKVFCGINNPIVLSAPDLDCSSVQLDESEMYPACAVTRAMRRVVEMSREDEKRQGSVTTVSENQIEKLQVCDDVEEDFSKDLNSLFCHESDNGEVADELSTCSVERKNLIDQQKVDAELRKIAESALIDTEISDVPTGYYKKDGILMRKWRPSHVSAGDDWLTVHQIVIPRSYRRQILSLAHDSPMAGHLGINKTCNRIQKYFYWPGMRKDVALYCKTCHNCQVVGKPNQKITAAPLYPIPAMSEPFSKVIVDCVGPLPKTKAGNAYLLTIMCQTTRYPEAIPLRKISTSAIVKALTKFFTTYGLPQFVQTDQGSNFLSGVFQQTMKLLGIQHQISSAYHPESQGAVERFHQTLKNMIRTYCYDTEKEWDEGISVLLFAVRECVQESLGFSPFELVFGHEVRGPLRLLREKWLSSEGDSNILRYVMDFRRRLTKACELARANLSEAQRRMKSWYDKNTRPRSFSSGDKVLVFLPVPGPSLKARYFGPYVVERKISNLNYVVQTPGRRKKSRLCHINQMRPYFERNDFPMSENKGESAEILVTQIIDTVKACNGKDDDSLDSVPHSKLCNSEILNDLTCKIKHLSEPLQDELSSLLHEYSHLFSDVPTKTHLLYHDIDVGSNPPVKQHPYRINPLKHSQLREEISYMLENGIIEPSMSEWSSPCILVPKADGSMRFCTDFRRVNALTRDDSYPIPRIDDCIDLVGNAKFVTKIDLLKGYWQIPLTERAKRIFAFVTPDGLYQYCVLPFGLRTAPATFQRLINSIIAGIDGCKAYLNDVIIYANSWKDHVAKLQALFDRLTKANLTINLAKSDFAQAKVTYLGYTVGQGQVCPLSGKIEAIDNYPVPKTKREVMRFLGMAGYYRRFCKNFSDVVAPLTDLLKKKVKFKWSESCEAALKKIKAMLVSSPILVSPNFDKPFILYVDASDIGAGAVLCQADSKGIDHPVCFFSKKFDKHQKNYSTVEKETLGLILALRHFEVSCLTSP